MEGAAPAPKLRRSCSEEDLGGISRILSTCYVPGTMTGILDTSSHLMGGQSCDLISQVRALRGSPLLYRAQTCPDEQSNIIPITGYSWVSNGFRAGGMRRTEQSGVCGGTFWMRWMGTGFDDSVMRRK